MEGLLIGLIVVGLCTLVYKLERSDFVKRVEDIEWDEEWF